MKRRFLALLCLIVAGMSAVAVGLSLVAVKGGVEKLILERAGNRLSLIIMGFDATASGVYSYVDSDSESIVVKEGDFTVFQYGALRPDPDSRSIRKIERAAEPYDFTLFLDFGAEVTEYLAPLRLMIVITAAIYAVLFAAAGWLFVGMVVDPIADLAARVASVTPHSLGARIPPRRQDDEISQLIAAFNVMLDEVEMTYDRQARFIEDMTHDIVTPVQILEGYRQLIERHGKSPELVDEYLEASRVQLARLKDMTASLKAALVAERRSHVELADASGITSRNVAYYRDLFPDIAFDADIADGVRLPIAAADLERIENILIDNAVKYGRDGGRVEIALAPGELRVRDFGVGIEDTEAVFDRYRRGPEAEGRAGGSGLGLSILRGFSEEYGFKVGLESRPGGGCAFTIRFYMQT